MGNTPLYRLSYEWIVHTKSGDSLPKSNSYFIQMYNLEYGYKNLEDTESCFFQSLFKQPRPSNENEVISIL